MIYYIMRAVSYTHLVSTAKELQLFSDIPLEEKHITAEACVAHLLYRQQAFSYTHLDVYKRQDVFHWKLTIS